MRRNPNALLESLMLEEEVEQPEEPGLLEQLAPFAGLAPAVGGAVGGAIGTAVGGPAGTAIGGGIGGALGQGVSMGANFLADQQRMGRERRQMAKDQDQMRELARKRALASFL